MLSPKYLPTRLILPSERPSVEISDPSKPSRLRPLKVLAHLLRLSGLFFRLRLTRRFHGGRYAVEVRNLLESFGGIWIKVGQMLCLRNDLFSTEFCAELSGVRDAADGVPFETIRETLEQQLHRPLEHVFSEFTEVPFLATSCTQFHRVYLRREQCWVLVKIHKPCVSEFFRQDLALIRFLARLFKALSVLPNMDWDSLVRQIRDQMAKELDFRYEAASLKSLKKNLRPHGVYVPDVFKAYSGQRILVMEFIHAALMSDYIALKQSDPRRLDEWVRANNINPKKVARRLFHSVYRQIFENNYFHADMHPGNVILLRNSRLAIIDCRAIGILEKDLLTKYGLFLKALTGQKYSTAADIYMLLATRLPPVDTNPIKANLVRVWRVWETRACVKKLPYNAKSISYMFGRVNRVVIENKFTIQWTLNRLMKAWENLDQSLSDLSPEIIYHKELYRYFRGADRRIREANRGRALATTPASLAAIGRLREKFSEYTIFQQSILRSKAQMLQGQNTAASCLLAAFFGFFSMALLFLELFVLGATLFQCFDYPIDPAYGAQIGGLIRQLPAIDCKLLAGAAVLLPFLYFRIRKLKKRFEQVDIVVPDVHAAV